MSVAYEYIDPSWCLHCFTGQGPHQAWHGTRADYLKIGDEVTKRVRQRNRDEVRFMSDEILVGYGQRLRRQLAVAAADDWDEIATGLVTEWLEDVEKEYRWRQRAASMGAEKVSRQGASWADRVDVVKRDTDLSMLIAWECHNARPIGTRGWKCACPFHDDKTPSLDIDTRKNVWLCRACGVGGDAITYAELKYGLSFVEAVKHLEDRLGIKQPGPVRFVRGISSDN